MSNFHERANELVTALLNIIERVGYETSDQFSCIFRSAVWLLSYLHGPRGDLSVS